MYRRPRKRLKGYVVEDRNVCKLCGEGPDEEMFGKFFVDESSGFAVHQYCMFFASGLAQRGEDDEGFDGFLIKDIKKEISRSRRLRCNFCKKLGATIGCCDKGCPQTFHYKCGRQRGGLFQFFDSFNSFCLMHRPTQGVNLKHSSNQTCPICLCQIDWNSKTPFTDIPLVTPCCKMTWFHNSCLQKHAQSSGSYFFRCPICNNVDKFQEEMKKMGIFIPEQDASWETGDAFADLHSQYSRCDAKRCICPNGREHNETAGEWHICLCDICGQAGTHVKCQHWKRSPREWYCDVCGDIHPQSSTRQRKIGDRSMDPSCFDDDDDDESSSAEDLDVNVCSVSDDEISYGIVKDRDVVGTSHTLRGENSVEKLVREGASPMRKRPRLSLECTDGQSPRFSGTNGDLSPSFSSSIEGHSKISLDTPTCSGTQFKDMTPEVLIAISDTIFSGVAGTIQGPGDMAKQCTSTSTKESETTSIDSDTASEASVELIKIERKPELLDLKRKPIARREKKKSKSENYTSSDELVSVAGSESPSKRKQNLSTTTEKRGIDVVEADSSGFSVKVEGGTEPTASDSKQDDVDSDEDSCIITNVVKKPCPVGNDKFGMKCYLDCCNPTFYCDYHQFLTSAKTKDLQITTVSSTSGSTCDHFHEKSSQAVEQHSLSDQTSTGADNEEKAHVCSVGTNTLPLKPSSRKKQELPATEAATTQSLFPEGKMPVSSSDRNKTLSLRSKKSASYHERSLKGLSSLREDNMTVTQKCFR